ncbi:hypothetical protein [Methylomonas sp. MgM2]
MNVSPTSSGVAAINLAQNKVAEAAQAIAQVPSQQLEQGVKGPGDLKSTDYVRPLTSLIEAESQAKAGTKVLKAEKEMIGSLFDATA